MAARHDGAGGGRLEGTASAFKPGVLTPVAPLVRRLVAPNASLMTGPGTNTYLLGDPVVAIIDPGPNDAGHIAAILAFAPQARCVFVTHTHADHSPAARVVGERLGAEQIGRLPPDDGRQDLSFRPDTQPVRDQIFDLGELALKAIDTPGHASNHVCYLLQPGGLLFSGDHLLEGVTPVILAPDGDMAAYLDSLERLKSYPLEQIAPGHGGLYGAPMQAIDAVIAHRLTREREVLAALHAVGAVSIDALLPQIYRHVPTTLQRFARCSLEAHLIKLERDGRCRQHGLQDAQDTQDTQDTRVWSA